MKLCLIYNFAQHYRANIFKLISEEFDCDFLFGDSMGDVKKMDYSLLRGKVTETHTLRIKGWYWQPKVISQLFKKYDSYILLGETRSVSAWMFCLLQRILFPKKKVYFWTHGWYGKESRLEALIKKVFLRLPNGGIFLYGNYARNLMIKEGFEPEKLYVIHNSLAYDKQIELRSFIGRNDIYREHFKNTYPNIFFVGRLTAIKKIEQLIMALHTLKQQGKGYNLTIIGDGEKREELEGMVSSLCMKDSVWFYGSCYDERELGTMIYNADSCVSPGNVGLTAIHSMSFGTPVMTHDKFAYQMPEFEAIKEGETGGFFRYDDVNSIAGSIEEWFDKYAGSREKTRLACYSEIDKNWTPYAQLDLLKKVLTPHE